MIEGSSEWTNGYNAGYSNGEEKARSEIRFELRGKHEETARLLVQLTGISTGRSARIQTLLYDSFLATLQKAYQV